MDDTYLTIAAESTGIYKDKGSKFLAFAYPVSSEVQLKEHLERLRKEHHSARHHCWAYRLGSDGASWKANDDGEPSNSAGRPILGQLVSRDVTNVGVVVVRYFGGTLLGVGGLIQAYREATADALDNARVVEALVESYVEVKFAYQSMNEVMKILKDDSVRITDQIFDNFCSTNFWVRKSAEPVVLSRLAKIESLQFENV